MLQVRALSARTAGWSSHSASPLAGTMEYDDMKSVTKPERTLTTLHLVVIGFFWTSGG